MKKNFWTLLMLTIVINTLSPAEQEYKLGDPDIDNVRVEVKNQESTEANYKKRTKIMYM